MEYKILWFKILPGKRQWGGLLCRHWRSRLTKRVHRNRNQWGSFPVRHFQMPRSQCNRIACRTEWWSRLQPTMPSSSLCSLLGEISVCPVFYTMVRFKLELCYVFWKFFIESMILWLKGYLIHYTTYLPTKTGSRKFVIYIIFVQIRSKILIIFTQFYHPFFSPPLPSFSFYVLINNLSC